MPVTLVWDDDEKRTLRWVFTDPWTWADVQAADDESTTLHDDASAPIHAILDFRESTQVPRGILARFPDVAHMMDDHPMGASPIVIVGVKGIAKRLASIMERWNALVAVCDDLDAAYTIIGNARQAGNPTAQA